MQETILSYETIDHFQRSLSEKGKSPNTIRGYQSDLRQLLQWSSLQFIPLEDMEKMTMSWLNQFRKGIPAKTTNRRLTSVRSFMRWAGVDSFLKDYNSPTPAPTEPHPLPGGKDTLHKMAELAKNPRRKALVALCGFAGLRMAEALSVTCKDIDLTSRTITVRGKGDKGRVVPLSNNCWMYVASAYTDAYIDNPQDSIIGYKDRFARKIVTDLGRQVGIKRPVASHDLRATFATEAYNKTRDIRAVQELLGHASPDTTQIYTEASMKARRNAAEF